MIKKVSSKQSDYRRLKEILGVFMRHGFGSFIGQTHLLGLMSLGKRFKLTKQSEKEIRDLPEEVRLRMSLEELGPLFIKFGQILANRGDLIPPEYIDELKKLRVQVAPFSLDIAKEVIASELGQPLDKIFKQFDDIPRGAASMAQVYHAQLQDGRDVAVKVLRPGIRRMVVADLSVLGRLASLLERHVPDAKMVDPVAVVEEFRRVMSQELNLIQEAHSTRRFHQNFKGSDVAHIPEPYIEYCTKKVLVMEWIDGVDLFDVEAIDKAGLDRHTLAQNGLKCFLKQILKDGFFHADPHTGNSFAMPDNRVAIFDFGMVGRIDEELMESIAKIFLALDEHNYNKLIHQFTQMGMITQEINPVALKKDIRDLAEPLYGLELKYMDLGEIFAGVLSIARNHHMTVPRDLMLLLKALLAVEGVAKELDTDSNVLETAKPYALSLLKTKFSPENFAATVKDDFIEIGEAIRGYPKQISYALDNLVSGETRFKMDMEQIDDLADAVLQVGNRMAVTLIICASLLGGAFILNCDITSIFGFEGVPVSKTLGFLSYIMASVLGIWLIYGIIRSGDI